MVFRLLAYAFLLLVALSACGNGPDDSVVMDRRFLTTEGGSDQVRDLKAGLNGEILDEHAWRDGEELVYTVMTRESDTATGEEGVFLRHYLLEASGPNLRWTYRDTAACLGAAAGAMTVNDQSPELRPLELLPGTAEQFVLCYVLQCGETNVAKSLVVVNAASGTPEVRLQGDATGLYDAHDLVGLPEDTVQWLLTVWEG
ncbi:MAG: hypothetical protein AAFN92_06210 [Bacteroidota bacterium]